ncbi:FAD binding domain-containing protein [Georgenia sp. MJ173]|uniref:xanthine dehydrogenase small subunit n=1 Tax=Georgenia sunbinii TaxID=3117728 RepID=UPI002F26AC48
MGPAEVTVNGRVREIAGTGVHATLLDWLRAEGLTGAKEGCAEGECGACAVLVARPDGDAGTRWTAVNACLPPALALDGQEVITAEGLGTAAGAGVVENLHPVQREMAHRGGSQCGYCTPGFVCAMAAEYYRPERRRPVGLAADDVQPSSDGDLPTDGDLSSDGQRSRDDDPSTDGHGETDGHLSADGQRPAGHGETGPNGFDLHALSGNLCRCTGYRPIRDAAYALGDPDVGDPVAERRARPAPAPRATSLAVGGAQFWRPATLAELLAELAERPEAQLVAGATDLGVEVNIRHARPARLVAIDRLEELRTLTVAADHIEIGAALTLSEIERALDGQVPMLTALFPLFASRLIRNSATLGGNLGTASPIGDAAPALLALDAALVLAASHGERAVALSEYFTGYRQTLREPGEIIRAVRIPLPLREHTAFHKIAKRRFDDISSVAVALAARFDGGTVTEIRIGLGGVAATPVRAGATEEALRGRAWTRENVVAAAAVMAGEGTPMDDHRASARYRSAMLEQSLLRFYAEHDPSRSEQVP